MATPAKVRYLADYIWDAPDDGNRYEVINGELVVTPAPSWDHQNSIGELFMVVRLHVRTNRLGWVVDAPTGVVLESHTGVEPDILFISRERGSIITKRGVEGAPDLVVEALSPSTESRDRGTKMQAYASAGVPHYWLLDVAHRALEVLELHGDDYELVGVYHVGDVFEPPLFPGLSIRIADLFE